MHVDIDVTVANDFCQPCFSKFRLFYIKRFYFYFYLLNYLHYFISKTNGQMANAGFSFQYHNLQICFFGFLGPLHMSTVDQACLVIGINFASSSYEKFKPGF